MLESPVKVRFCPSPTGLMHFGNARTALFNYLFARHQDGLFLLRIEDTDLERSKTMFDRALRHDLHWLGIDWDEGPEKEGEYGPYYQSKRQAIYSDYYNRLILAGAAYPCFCSEAQLALTRRAQRTSGKPPRYPGTCRSLSAEMVQAKRQAGIQPTLRFAVPQNQKIVFEDWVRGTQTFDSDDIGDFIIRRADGTSPFMFCNAVDDALMQVTHVLRGEDHVANTPRQILILAALGFSIPTYGHFALIVGNDGAPLSKRHGSRSIETLRELGYLPQAINNYLARLGHYFENTSLMTLSELSAQFQISALSKSPAKFDEQQLNHWQKEAVMQLDFAALWNWLDADTKKLIPENKKKLFLETFQPNVQLPQDLKTWAMICFQEKSFDVSTHHDIFKQASSQFFEIALQAFTLHAAEVNKIAAQLQSNLNIKGKAIYHPLRLALTGRADGPELAKILLLIEPEYVKSRLKGACV